MPEERLALPNAAETIRPEIEVLVCCARRRLETANRERLQSLTQTTLDWPAVLRLATDHGLLPLLYEHLTEIATDSIPPDIRMQLQQADNKNALRSFFLSAELLRVMEGLDAKSIPAVPYKGPVLAARAYGKTSLRQFDDLDIVMPHRHIAAAFEAMNSLGYAAKLPRESVSPRPAGRIPGEYVFIHKVNRAMVEIHTELTLRHFPIKPDLEAMIRRAVPVFLDGKKVQTFSPEDELLMLAVHGAKDFWARLVWVSDVAEVVKQASSMNWQGIFEKAQRTKTSRMVKLSLALAQEILGLQIGSEAQNWIVHDPGVRRLGDAARARLLGGGRPPESVFGRSAFRMSVVEGFASGTRYWLRLSTAPAQEDWSAIRMPRSLSWFYAFLRPLRLLKKYGTRTSRDV